MKLIKQGFILINCSILFMCVGCGPSKYNIVFNSNPPGAMVICAGNSLGYTPVTLSLGKSVKDKDTYARAATELLERSLCSANWVSGATAYYNTAISLAMSSDGLMFTANRPNYAEGFREDAEFALKVLQVKIAQQQAEAAQQQAEAAQRQAEAAKRQAEAANRPVTCYSLGNGFVTCY